ncbi:MAG: M28 family peptidase [Candidatus Kapabacteria bacterium]|nr:M28 family peptidase [Candidatus Kapabacteria bacterium]
MQSYRFYVVLALASSLALRGFTSQSTDALSLTAQRLQTHVRFLASPDLEGRAAGSKGNHRAAEYIAQQFQRAGLQPIASSYFQPFSMITDLQIGVATRAEFSVTVERIDLPREMWRSYTFRWIPGKDFVPLSFSANGTASGTLVFAGFGISAPERQYDDYEGVDVRGKLVLILRGTPWDERLRSKLVREKLREEQQAADPRYASLRYKVSTAEARGAAAVIIVDPQGDSSNVLLPLSPETMSPQAAIPVIHAQRVEAVKLFPRERSLYTRELEILRTQKPHSFELPLVTGTIVVQLETSEAEVPNVLGYARGTDPQRAHEYIVVGAHFDHIGWGSFGSLAGSKAPTIHPGADDNASGTAVLLELAERVAQRPLPRSVLFIAFNAEERGAIGSSYYVRHPVLPMDSAIAMFNLDMVGRLKENTLTIQGVGSSSIWRLLLDSLAPEFGLRLSTTESGFGPSDHTPFHARGLPVLFFFTGLHSDYHRPTDTWDKLNYEGIVQITNLVEALLRAVAHRPGRPDFQRTQSLGEFRGDGRPRVRLGIIPDYSEHPSGLRINGVSSTSPAQRAGLQSDDVITALGTYRIRSIYDLMQALQQFAPGDTISVEFLRNGTPQKATIYFERP